MVASKLLKGRIRPPRIPEDGSSISSSDSSLRRKDSYEPQLPPHTRSEDNVLVTRRDPPSTQRSYSTSDVSRPSNSTTRSFPPPIFSRVNPDRQPAQGYAYSNNPSRAAEFRNQSLSSPPESFPAEALGYENGVSNEPPSTTMNGRTSSWDEDTRVQNSQYPSHSPRQQQDTSVWQHTPSQGPDSTRIANIRPAELMHSKTWHHAGDGRTQASLENYGALGQKEVAQRSNGEDSRPLPARPFSFANGTDHCLDEDSVPPRSSGTTYNEDEDEDERDDEYKEHNRETPYAADDRIFLPSLTSQSRQQWNRGTNLERSLQRYQDENAFQCDVHVWHNGLSKDNLEYPNQLKFITLLFDTQCEGSNWVAAKIVDRLGATVQPLPYPAEFVGFNGHRMTTSQQATLSFKNSSGGSTWEANFLVSPVHNVPFDMLLGAEDCLRFNIISPPRLLGLARRKQSNREKEEEAAKLAQHAKDVEKNNRKVQEMKNQKKNEQRRGESSQYNNKEKKSKPSK